MTTSIDGSFYRKLLLGGGAVLEANKETVNNLNVFPVPDGDTGTNMGLTMSAISTHPDPHIDSIGAYASYAAKDMMRSARGNSGVILSLFFRGMARVFEGHDTADAALLTTAFREGAKSAALAVDKPAEGTILTIMRECCADDVDTNGDIGELLEEYYKKAVMVLPKTTEMLPALKRARVVDSGGCGFVHILDGMRRTMAGEDLSSLVPEKPVEVANPVGNLANFGEYETEDIKFSFCTEALLDLSGELPVDTVRTLREYLSAMGDSMVLTTDDEILKLHIHTNEPFCVLEYVTSLGTLRFSKIENMKLQHKNLLTSDGKTEIPASELTASLHDAAYSAEAEEKKKFGIFAVASGAGFADLFHELGADRVIEGGQSMNPSAEDIIDAIKSCPCENAIILPNNSNIILTAKQVSRILDDTNIVVVKTKTVPQGLGALVAYNQLRSPEENLEVMMEASEAIKTLSFTRAVRDAELDGLSIKKRDFMGLVEDDVKTVGEDLLSCVEALIPEMQSYEIITVYSGRGVKERETEEVVGLLKSWLPDDCEIIPIEGGQPIYPFVISAE
ncbi:MAG: DAK2 domain-containing protein [Firmicutes bacterium]|nr:DAK2 domain-containing protein [Bacillota bacterium]